MTVLITHPISGKVVGSFTAPPWIAATTTDEEEELHMAVPTFLTLCGLAPFLFIALLHLLYAYRCWPQYSRNVRWLGLVLLNVLVLVPYVNVVALPVAFVWLCVALAQCRHAPSAALSSPLPRQQQHVQRPSSASGPSAVGPSSGSLSSGALSLE